MEGVGLYYKVLVEDAERRYGYAGTNVILLYNFVNYWICCAT